MFGLAGGVAIEEKLGSLFHRPMNTYQRTDGRGCDELRPVTFSTCVVDACLCREHGRQAAGKATGIAPYADGAVLACFEDTRVICAASFEKKIPRWISQQGIGGGWITAEYSDAPLQHPRT